MRTSEKRRQSNIACKSKMRTFVQKLRTAVADGNKDQARQLLDQIYTLYDKAVKKGVLKPNNAARQKSKLSLKVNALTGGDA